MSAFFIGGAGIATLIHTATAEFSNFSQIGAATNAILTATGGAAHVTATGIQELASSIEHKTGIDDEQVKSAENVLLTFRAVRNEVGRGNDIFTRATKSSADLSRVFGTDVASTARQLGRALQDPTRGLLTLRRAGLTFTTQQTKLIKSLADTGQLLKAQTLILDEVDRRVGGTAETIGRTLPGQLNILRERAKDALGEYVRRLSESRDAAEAARQGGAALAAGFGAIRGAVQTLGPPLVEVAKEARSIEGAIGAGPIIAAVVGYKALGAAVALTARAQAAYAKLAAVAAGSNGALAGTAVEASAALRTETVALAGLTVATRGYVTASGLAVIENDRVAASAVRAGLAGRAAALGTGASRIALAAVGGPLGVAAIGAGALAAGFILIRRAAANAAGGIIATRHALDDYNASVNRSRALRIRVSGARDAITQTRAVAQAAAESLADAEGRQRRSSAAPGSLEQRALADQVRVARAALAQATKAAADAEGTLAAAQRGQTRVQENQPAVITEATRKILDQIGAIRNLSLAQANVQTLGAGVIVDPDAGRRAERALQRFTDLMEELRSGGDRAGRVVGGALEKIAVTLQRLPTEKQIRVVLQLAGEGRSVEQIVRELGVGIATGVNEQIAQQLAARAHQRVVAQAADTNTALQQEFAAAQKILRVEEKKLATRKEAAATARREAEAAREAVQNATDALTNANEQLAASQRALADAIATGRDAVNAAVKDAKTNLRSIADSIADAIGRFADQGAAKIGPQGPLAKRFKELRDQIVAGRGGPDTQRAAQEVAARLQAQQTGGDDVATRAKRRLDDLSDAFARGRIGPAQFNAGVQRVLRDFGVNLRQFGKTFGSAALHDLQDQLRAARQQAQAIAAGPRRPGGGGEPNIVRPLEAVARAQRDTRQATRDVLRATRDVARAQRDLQTKQYTEARATTKAVQRIARAAEAQLRVTRQQEKLRKDKPTGSAGKGGQTIVTSGAGAP